MSQCGENYQNVTVCNPLRKTIYIAASVEKDTARPGMLKYIQYTDILCKLHIT